MSNKQQQSVAILDDARARRLGFLFLCVFFAWWHLRGDKILRWKVTALWQLAKAWWLHHALQMFLAGRRMCCFDSLSFGFWGYVYVWRRFFWRLINSMHVATRHNLRVEKMISVDWMILFFIVTGNTVAFRIFVDHDQFIVIAKDLQNPKQRAWSGSIQPN